jgi:hypothetical protein
MSLKFVMKKLGELMLYLRLSWGISWLKTKALATRHDVLEANAFTKKNKFVQFLSIFIYTEEAKQKCQLNRIMYQYCTGIAPGLIFDPLFFDNNHARQAAC